MVFHEIDLRKIRQDLGDHYQASDRDVYEGLCQCDEFVTQAVSDETRDGVPLCPYCDIRIVWHGSRLWKQLYGSPADAAKRLAIYDPEDSLGLWLMDLALARGFANKGELADWKHSLKYIDETRFKKAVRGWRASQRKKGYRSSGRAMTGFAINLIRKWTREAKDRSPSGKKTIEVTSW